MIYRCAEGLKDQTCEGETNVTCYRCGFPVCKACSTVDMDPFRGRKTRRCRSCRQDEAKLSPEMREKASA